MIALKQWSVGKSLFAAALLGLVVWIVVSVLPSQNVQSLASRPAVPASYLANVIKVSDGDSITVLSGNDTIKIRLAQIDAPERGQPWGRQSHQALAALVGGKSITINPVDRDRYGRTIADIDVNGQDVNEELVKRGAAWAYPDYVYDQSIIELEMHARAARAGLWAMPAHQRIPPWEYRRRQRDTGTPVIGR